ncbi:alkaline phosphatase D family protein [Actinokineospora fastidiosa]|uniref:Phosphatidic acid phosphatase type 2/haloperoxidase domain-containing protein n=1 Tax=Actinokineospora fastidiosa TaxID=1816 RepID=A0A918LC87_9PSEU|nr:alkaline phosphatase D family protein [Actinokineospora fastidiosa]GGS28743.1 hypothetical protein GCM10010171_22340 [Actinokineospora fastidiosa]
MNRKAREDWLSDLDITRTHIFVPAIMSAGILISLFTLVRDALHGRNRRGHSRRAALEAHATAHHVLTGEPAHRALAAGLRPRAGYLLAALSSAGFAVYVAIGATANYFRPNGFVENIVWLWAASLGVSMALSVVAAVCAVAFLRWPKPARWQLPLLAHSPLGQPPTAPRVVSVLLLGWAAALTGAAAAIFTFVVAGAPHRLAAVDAWVAATAPGLDGLAGLGVFDPLGPLPVYLAAVAVIGLAAVRCTAVPVAYVIAAAVGLLLDVGLDLLVPRDRPVGGAADSFPSGHEVQALLLIGFAPMALLVLTRRAWLAWAGAALLAAVAVAAGLTSLQTGAHWWSDMTAGALWGAAAALTGWWALAYPRWHRHCGDCPLSVPHHPGATGLLRLPWRVEHTVRWAARIWVPITVAGFGALALVVGLPANPEGDGVGGRVAGPLQLALLGLVAVGWLVALRWEAAGALLLALAGSVLGTLAALAYHPLVSLAVALVFLAPAVGFWLVWQHRRTLRAIAVLAVSTTLLLSGTWVGALTIYDRYYGPAHPASTAPILPVDRVVWSWAGGVTTESAVVVAKLAEGARRARLGIAPSAGAAPVRSSPEEVVGADGVVRMVAVGLAPGTAYRYEIEVDGVADASRGVGELRTAPDGPASMTVAFGGCARTGSNGAVFDAIRAIRPDLYVITGDVHYGNPAENDVERFASLYGRVLTAPAQAALYRSVPVAYVWDDHDYGPNDADASAPTRQAARAAYARHVPHYPLAGGADGTIHQAFTIGRVRFVLTDTRSERTAATMLGKQQLAWLQRELVTASRSHALVVWVNPAPWVAPASPGRDDWGGYPDERARLAATIAGAGVRNLVMVSGDAHMVAVDDGTNTGYSDGPGFPLLHAAALDRPGGVKGGPYSGGVFPGAGQFGTVSVTDTGGSSIEVTLTGRDWRGTVLVQQRFTLPAR